jgi:tRNA nucleotidyltransferase/poly(A) polymerase
MLTASGYCSATSVIHTLTEAGYEAYFVGGCVRDMLLGFPPKDYDIVTSARPEQTQALFPRSLSVGAQFGVITVLSGGYQFDVATFRTEGGYNDGRHPTWVAFSGLEQDIARRDFTINGLALDAEKSVVLDVCGGMQDLSHGVIRTIGDPFARFGEDALRLLRAVRFGARFGFRVDETTHSALIRSATSLDRVARERIWQELDSMLLHETRAAAFGLLTESRLLRPAFGDRFAWKPETIASIQRRLSALPSAVSSDLAWTCVLADFYAAPSAQIDIDMGLDDARFDRAAARGAEMTLLEMRSPADVAKRAGELIGRRWLWRAANNLRYGSLAQLLRNDSTGDLLLFWQTDAAAHGKPHAVERARQIAESLAADGKMLSGASRPPVTGKLLLEAGISPDARMGAALAEAERAWLEGKLDTQAEVAGWVKDLSTREAG